SNDNGETWRPSMRSMPSRLITYAIVQDTRNPDLLYLGTNLGVYRSIDRGTSWAPVWSPTATDKKKPTAKRSTSRTATTARTRAVAPKTSDETVLAVQQALVNAGYHLGEPDGKIGTSTIAAVKKFQTDRHLPITGKLDSITLAALGVNAGSGS